MSSAADLRTQYLRQCTQIWLAAVECVNGKNATRKAIMTDRDGPWQYVVSVGKAASAMLEGAKVALTSDARVLLVTKYQHTDASQQNDPRIEVIESGHPMPDENSLRAGAAVTRFVQSIPESASLLVLVSGGASALVESLRNGMDLVKLQALSARLLADGYSIDQINHVRIAVSKIKGGKLLNQFRGKRIRVYSLSDIPGDDEKLIGSGIGAIQPPKIEPFSIPADIQALMDSVEPITREFDHDVPKFKYQSGLVGSNSLARLAASQKALSLNLPLIESNEILKGDVMELAPVLAKRVNAGGVGAYIWGGEPTVSLPDRPGDGGRNQSLAIALGIETADQEGVYGLVAGTDGSDGPTRAAGGYFYSGMPLRGAAKALQRADAGTWLDRVDQRFSTGPTGTNVMDLAVVIKQK